MNWHKWIDEKPTYCKAIVARIVDDFGDCGYVECYYDPTGDIKDWKDNTYYDVDMWCYKDDLTAYLGNPEIHSTNEEDDDDENP